VHQIGLATREDLPYLPGIERRACDLFLQVPMTRDLPLYLTPERNFTSAQEEGRLWVACGPDGSPIGFALVERVGAEWHLEEMDVLPEHGRQGIGRALLRAVCAWVAAQGERTLTLTTFRDVPWNAPFYERFGFQPLGEGELTDGLRRRLAEEAEHGLPPEVRVAMRIRWT
jgi:GNAT superfamily N-acetyltransferase